MSAPASRLGSGGPGGPSWESLARAAASPPREPGVPLRELIAVEVAGEGCALPVERVREVLRPGRITPVPRVPDAVRGVVSLRGEIVQVIDLGLRLGLSRGEISRRSRVVALHAEEGRAAALLVDAATQVLRVAEDAIRPAAAESRAVEALVPHRGRFLSLIDVERVIDLGSDG